MRFKVIVPAFIVLILLSGCIDSLSPDKRFLCLDLTEKSYAFVPECDSEQKCFALVQKTFFDFDYSVFGSNVNNKLHSYKNNVALSWLYFNKARKNIETVHGICLKNSSISGLIFELNELTHNMAKAFEFSDLANRESFSILMLEHSDLEKEDVRLVREEPLYNDFALLGENINRLSSGEDCSTSETYSCFYLSQAGNFQSLVSQTGFENKIMSETNAFDLLLPFSEEIGKYANANLEIPFINSTLSPLLSFLSNFSTTRNSMDALERTPAFGFMHSYNGFMGEENSCLSKFGEIVSGNALHRKQLIQRNALLEQTAWSSLDQAEKSTEALLSETYSSFDQNFFQKLYSGLDQDEVLSSQKYGVRDFGELRIEAESKLKDLEQRLLELQSQNALGTISLGKQASDLKELNLEISNLEQNLEYLRSETIQGLLVLCDERASFIEQDLEKPLSQEYLFRASDLKARTKYRLILFFEAKETEEKLSNCKEMVDEFSTFTIALQDFEYYLLEEEETLASCFSSLEAIFGTSKESSLNFGTFSIRFQELNAVEKPYTDLAAVQRVCLSLKNDLEEFLQSNGTLNRIEENFAKANRLFEELSLAKTRGYSISASKMKSLDSQLAYFASFFLNNKPLIEKTLPVLQNLDSSLLEFVQVLEEELNLAIASLAEKNALVSIAPLENPLTGTAFDETVSIELENLFSHTVTAPLRISIPFEKSVGSQIVSSSNILNFQSDGKNLIIDLNSLPPGLTLLQFSTESIVERTEKLALISASSEKALFSKEIKLKCERLIPKLQVETLLLGFDSIEITDLFVSYQEQAPAFSLNQNKLSFFVENCIGSQTVTVLFSIPKPVELILSKLEQGLYSLTIKNRLNVELKNLEVILELHMPEESFSGIELVELSGKKVKFAVLPGKKISFSISLLFPMQQRSPLLLKVPFSESEIFLEQAQEEPDLALQKEAEAVQEKILLLASRTESAENTLALLQSLLSSVSDEQVISAKYVLPISGKELDSLGLDLSNLKSFLSKPDLQQFSDFVEKGNFGLALEKSTGFEKQLDEKILNSNTLLSRAETALDAIREDALVSYNSAVALFNTLPPDSKAKQELEKAQGLLLDESFLDAIVHSKNATAMLSLPSNQELNFPLFLIPVIACAGLVLAVRFGKKKATKQKKELVKMVEKGWQP